MLEKCHDVTSTARGTVDHKCGYCDNFELHYFILQQIIRTQLGRKEIKNIYSILEFVYSNAYEEFDYKPPLSSHTSKRKRRTGIT